MGDLVNKLRIDIISTFKFYPITNIDPYFLSRDYNDMNANYINFVLINLIRFAE